MSNAVPFVLFSGIALILFGYSVWKGEKKESLLDGPLSTHPVVEAGLAQDLVPLWFVPDQSDQRLLKLEDRAVKILRTGPSMQRFVIHHAVAVYDDEVSIELEDFAYTVNGKREGSALELDPVDEEPVVVEADTTGFVSERSGGRFLRMKGIIVFLESVSMTDP